MLDMCHKELENAFHNRNSTPRNLEHDTHADFWKKNDIHHFGVVIDDVFFIITTPVNLKNYTRHFE